MQRIGELRRVLFMDIDVATVIQCPVDLVQVRTSLGFDDMYRREYPGLVAVATTMTGDLRDGEDLVQDTMVKAYIRWDRVGRLDRPGAWCHRVLLNACRSLLRRAQRHRRFVERQRRDELWSDGPSAAVMAFWEVVRTMPTRPRTVVALYFAGELSTVEIAFLLGCPEGTVRSDLTRPRVVLARHLGCGE